jgi:hypothetical protein
VSPLNVQISNRIYSNLCKNWATTLECPGLAKKLKSSMLCDTTSHTSTLELTAKTHKSPVDFRNLHASHSWKYGALSKFVSNIMQAKLNTFKHVMRDSEAVVQALKEVPCSPEDKFCKLDVKHFFMSGTPTELSQLSSDVFEGEPIHGILKESSWFLLDNQHVVDKSTGKVYKVQKGSGMGLSHSGAIAELALYMGAERRMLQVLPRYNIVFYGRFKDDILIIFRDYRLLRDFLAELRKGHPFTLKCEEISSFSINFLEVCIRKSYAAFEIFPVSKPSSLQISWLSRFSSHSKNVHDSWPAARLSSRLKLCSSTRLKRSESVSFAKRAESEHLTRRALSAIRSTPFACNPAA